MQCTIRRITRAAIDNNNNNKNNIKIKQKTKTMFDECQILWQVFENMNPYQI